MTSRLQVSTASLLGLAAFALLAVAVNPAVGDVVAVVGNNDLNRRSGVAGFLAGEGHAVSDFAVVPTDFSPYDTVVLLRQLDDPGTTAGNAELATWVQGGGRLITEWNASEWALNVANLLDADDLLGPNFGGVSLPASPVTFTLAGVDSGLANGVLNPYTDGGRTDFFRNLGNFGAGVEVLATRPGDAPAIIAGPSGAGNVTVIGYDWSDDFANASPDTRRLIANAVSVTAPPMPTGISIGVFGNNDVSRRSGVESVLSAAGHDVIASETLPTSYDGLDVVVLLRNSDGDGSAAGNPELAAWVQAGGRLITGWNAAQWALTTADLLDADDLNAGPNFGGVNLGPDTAVTFTASGIASGLADGVSNPYLGGGATEYFREFSNIGPSIQVLATRPGDIPAILGGQSGAGSVIVIGYDWSDFFASTNSDNRQLLLNAVLPSTAVPEPTTLVLLAMGIAGLWGGRRLSTSRNRG